MNIAVRPENVRCGAGGCPTNQFTARVLARRYEGAHTVYELAVLDMQLEALELGTSARHAVDSRLEFVLPPALCRAYPADEDADLD